MSTPLPDGTPTALDIVRRAWDGRTQIRDLGINPDHDNLRIVLSPEAFDILRCEAGDLPPVWAGALASNFDVKGFAAVTWTLFGVPLAADRTLMRNEIRFRTEVAV